MGIISAERIFCKIIHDCVNNEFKADPVALHRAFYDLYESNQDKMQAFDFIIRINPYSPKLEELIFYYQLCGILARKNSELIQYTINRDKLNTITNEDLDTLELIKPNSITVIFGKN